jgi:hypothetical protein
MIEKIELGESSFNYQQAFSDCFIDVKKKVERPPIAMGIGYQNHKGINYLNPTFTYGEMSAIIAPKKSKKTFFKTALIASYIGGNTSNSFPSIVSAREGDKYIIDIDTEQGDFYSSAAAKRVSQLVGSQYPNYLPFGTKSKSDIYRVNLIDSIMHDKDFKDKIGLLVIDGIADLCTNFNNVERSNEVILKLMEWSSMGAHICGVIHKTFDKDKARGHLGTLYQEKIETSIFLTKTDKEDKNAPIEVRNEDSRGAPFDNFYFDLNLNFVLPKECDPKKW